MKPRYLPEVAHVYCGRWEYSGRCILWMMLCRGSSQSGMFLVFFALMSIVVMPLYEVMIVCSFLPCLVHEERRAAVSSAKVRKWVRGTWCCMIRSRESEEIAKINGDKGHP